MDVPNEVEEGRVCRYGQMVVVGEGRVRDAYGLAAEDHTHGGVVGKDPCHYWASLRAAVMVDDAYGLRHHEVGGNLVCCTSHQGAVTEVAHVHGRVLARALAAGRGASSPLRCTLGHSDQTPCHLDHCHRLFPSLQAVVLLVRDLPLGAQR